MCVVDVYPLTSIFSVLPKKSCIPSLLHALITFYYQHLDAHASTPRFRHDITFLLSQRLLSILSLHLFLFHRFLSVQLCYHHLLYCISWQKLKHFGKDFHKKRVRPLEISTLDQQYCAQYASFEQLIRLNFGLITLHHFLFYKVHPSPPP